MSKMFTKPVSLSAGKLITDMGGSVGVKDMGGSVGVKDSTRS